LKIEKNGNYLIKITEVNDVMFSKLVKRIGLKTLHMVKCNFRSSINELKMIVIYGIILLSISTLFYDGVQ